MKPIPLMNSATLTTKSQYTVLVVAAFSHGRAAEAAAARAPACPPAHEIARHCPNRFGMLFGISYLLLYRQSNDNQPTGTIVV